MTDFVGNEPLGGNAAEKERKLGLVKLLMIDSYNRRGELFQFKEQTENAIEDFQEVVKLCE